METGKIIWTDGSLIGAIKQPGRAAEDAIKQLYRDHYGLLEQYVLQNQGSRSDAEDKIYTPAEANSACGAKTRQLVREKSTQNPCGSQTRQLTREEPLPQTIYRVKTRAGQPSVVFVKLNARN